MSAHDCLSEYRKIAGSMFGSPRFASTRSPLYWPKPKYDHHPFESQFESLLRRYDKTFEDNQPRDSLLGSNTKCRTYVIPEIHSSIQLTHFLRIAVSWLRSSQDGSRYHCLFRSYKEPSLTDNNSSWLTEIPLWMISRALISSPRYFSPIKIRGHEFMGGKEQLHNPSLIVFEEVMRTVEKTDNVEIFFLSIGSGISGYSSAYNFSSAYDFPPSSSTGVSVPENTAQKSTRSKRYAYYRLNPGNKLGDIKFDDWQVKGTGEEVTIDRITRATKDYLSDDNVRRTLRAIAESLVRSRRASSERANMKRCVENINSNAETKPC